MAEGVGFEGAICADLGLERTAASHHPSVSSPGENRVPGDNHYAGWLPNGLARSWTPGVIPVQLPRRARAVCIRFLIGPLSPRRLPTLGRRFRLGALLEFR
jgi:hypothetical protein